MAFEVEQVVVPRAQHRSSRLALILPTTLVVLDAFLVLAAFLLAYWVRYSLKVGPEIQSQVPLSSYMPLGVMLLSVMIPILVLKGAYGTRLGRELVDEVVTIFSAATTTLAAIVVVTTMLHRYDYSRGLIVYLWVLVIALVLCGRALFRSLQGVFYRRGWGVRRLLVVGTSDVGKMVMQSVMSRPDLGYKLAGFVGDSGIPYLKDFGRFRALGTVADLPQLVESGVVDDIIIALPASAHEDIAPIVGLCERHAVGLKLVPDLFEMSLGRVRIDNIAGIPLLDMRDRPLRRLGRGAKRLIDVIVAGFLLLVTVPVWGLIALIIRLESGKPILLRQTRVGMNGRTFHCLKFRTMRRDALELRSGLEEYNEADGPLFKMRNDPRCTRLGRQLRRWSLDELPQLWNVLVGEMSLVGPRPPLPEEAAQYDSRQARRLEVKPGLTGIWQVSGRSDLGFDEMVMMDLYYVDNWSPVLDAKILTRTVIAVLRGDGAY